MLKRLQIELAQAFLKAQDFSAEACTAVNATFARLAHGPYFEDGNSQVILVEQSEAFFKAYQRRPQGLHAIDPLDPWYDQGDSYYEDEHEDSQRKVLYQPHQRRSWDDFDSTKVEGTIELPAQLGQQAEAFQAQFLSDHPHWQRLLTPTTEQMEARHTITLESFHGAEALHDRLSDLLGREHDRFLKLDGIAYHYPTWRFNDPHKNQRYILAHNGEEVVGLIHYLHRAHDNGLGFVAVAPGFRQRGVSQQLYHALLAACEAEGCLLKRTEPGEFTEKNPGITRAYDRLLSQQDRVLHASGYGFLYSALVRALDQHPYEVVLQAGKTICDEAMRQRLAEGRFLFDQGKSDHEATEAFKVNLKQLTTKPTGPQVGRRPRV